MSSFRESQTSASSSSKGKQHRKKHEDKNDKHHKHDRYQKSDKQVHTHAQATKSEKTGTTSSSSDNVDFLFVVNELRTHDTGDGLERDLWNDVIPFSSPNDYAEEAPGRVFRYRNGEVTDVGQDYLWIRPGRGQEGCIWKWDALDQSSQPMDVYKTYSVFRCWRFNPIIWTGSDVSVPSTERPGAPGAQFFSLHFRSPPGGVSEIWPSAGPNEAVQSPSVSEIWPPAFRYVAGRDPSWMPSLVPQQYSNPFADAPRSQGLRGELPVILGMMALAQSQSLFYPPTQWRKRQWHRAPQTGEEDLNPGPDEAPRGVLVQICLDPQGGEGSTAADLHKFEWYTNVVKDAPRQSR
ncbi:hypothetical protein QBC33DRAFT_289854 [Phialemonium atrogriseum]|uniref:Uncharacterized protein n=1 Tax=Phialemonium atrogriseum TaxID=1093897 RepID=A0AAJ0BUE1_9PEZI|nr:uncharacterized protein QBC33DRAFT_289854 [Phialemonium atrogriseum]KAK1762186.1 hypothetical protein QBC33DRAFT_289854 [Phialemonium atrogriseum]